MSLKTPAGIAQAGRSLKLLRNVPWYTSARPAIVHPYAFVSVTPGATLHTYGAWVQLVASTSSDVGLVWLNLSNAPANGLDNGVMWNVGVGAAGSESIIVPNLATGGVASLGYGVWIPVSIPAGSRVSIQAKASRTAGRQFFPTWFLYSTGAAAHSVTPPAVEVLGANPSASQGTALSGASGSWAEIVASTNKPYQSLFLMPTIHGTNTANINPLRLVLGIGPSGSEVEMGEAVGRTTTSEEMHGETTRGHLMWHCGPIPAGTRIAVRHNIETNPNEYGVNIVAVPYA